MDENGRCVCDAEKYVVTLRGECGCSTDEDCADDQFCNASNRTCVPACATKVCGKNSQCVATHHEARCICLPGFIQSDDENCHIPPPEEFPPPHMVVECPGDGIQVNLDFKPTLQALSTFDGFMYVKGYSKDPACRTGLPGNSDTVTFKVKFGSCGLVYKEVRIQRINYNASEAIIFFSYFRVKFLVSFWWYKRTTSW